MIKVGVIGLGKMGLSHLAILNMHSDISVVAVCDSNRFLLAALRKVLIFKCYSSEEEMMEKEDLDAVFIVTPSKRHSHSIRLALDRGLHVFCEKPMSLSSAESFALANLAEQKSLVGQVGYHFRFLATFQEAKRVIVSGDVGDIHHLRIEAQGPVVLTPKGRTWRDKRGEGGGCLYDYACHAVDIANFLVGPPKAVSGCMMTSVFSSDVDDQVYASLKYSARMTGQLSVNWSDHTQRKMFTRATLWGTKGKVVVDRQEIVVVAQSVSQDRLKRSETRVRNVTDFEANCNFYLRGEEYTAQVDHFVNSINTGAANVASFREAAQTDLVLEKLRMNAEEEMISLVPLLITEERKNRLQGLGKWVSKGLR